MRVSEREAPNGGDPALCRRHRVWGWSLLAGFATLGLALESLHAFKVGTYLDEPIRRELWRLAHAHGALAGLLHLAFAASLDENWHGERARLASRLLLLGSLLVPGGFLLGGAFPFESDPGWGVWLVPPGGLLFVVAFVLAAVESRRPRPG